MITKKSILLIYTGGTIGMIKGKNKSLKPLNFKKLTAQIPELTKIEAKITAAGFKTPIDSSNITPKNWIYLSKIIEKNYLQYDGFVILHGTDTMAYTASALSFLLEGLSKPVILTGSQLPIGVGRTDAKENLITSIEIAINGVISEVAIYFEYKLFRGNRTVKINTNHFEAFDSPNFTPLAESGVTIKYYNTKTPETTQSLKAYDTMNDSVGLIKLYPGINERLMYSMLNSDCQAIVLETFGSGNAPTESTFLQMIERQINNGKIILNISQCLAGSVRQGFYETSCELEKIGVISGKDMTTEAAITKLMFLLNQDLEIDKIKALLGKSIRGELTEII